MIAPLRWPGRARPAVILLAAIALGGCSSGDGERGPGLAETAGEAKEARTLAYEHTVAIDVPEGEVRKLHDQTIASCNGRQKGTCTVLSSKLGSGDEAWARVSMRATPAVVRAMISALGQQGEVTSAETAATDLARPIADADRNAAMLESYRARLEQLAGRAGNDADALIKVHRELAEVQSKIEMVAGEREQLRKQVELEILDVSIVSERHMAFSKPIARAFRDFGTNLSQGIAGAITGLAVLLPGALVVVFLVTVTRRWRRRRKASAG